MRMRTPFVTTMVLVAAALVAPAFSSMGGDEETHQYAIGVEGTEGVQLHMVLVAKHSAKRAPTLRAEIVTVPFETQFEASTFYVWFQTLGGDEEIGANRIRSVYKIDGETQGDGFGLQVKKGNTVKTGFGNL